MASPSAQTGANLTSLHAILKEAYARPDPLLSFKWMLADTTFPSFTPADQTGQLTGTPISLPRSYLEGIDLPFNNIEQGESVYFQGGKISFPGAHALGPTVSMTLYEDNDALTMKWLTAWKSNIKNFTDGTYFMPTQYKRDINLSMLNTKNDIVLNAKLIGLWPSDTTALQLGYGSGERLVMTQGFSIDRIIYTWTK